MNWDVKNLRKILWTQHYMCLLLIMNIIIPFTFKKRWHEYSICRHCFNNYYNLLEVKIVSGKYLDLFWGRAPGSKQMVLWVRNSLSLWAAESLSRTANLCRVGLRARGPVEKLCVGTGGGETLSIGNISHYSLEVFSGRFKKHCTISSFKDNQPVLNHSL